MALQEVASLALQAKHGAIQSANKGGDNQATFGTSNLNFLYHRLCMGGQDFIRRGNLVSVSKTKTVYAKGRHLWLLDSADKKQKYLSRCQADMNIRLCRSAYPTHDEIIVGESARLLPPSQRTSSYFGPKVTFSLLDVGLNKISWKFSHPSFGQLACSALSNDGRLFAACIDRYRPVARPLEEGHSLSIAPKSSGDALFMPTGIAIWKCDMHIVAATKECASHINCVTISPDDNALLCASGDRYFRLWKMVGSAIDELPLLRKHIERSCNFPCHTWLTSTCIAVVTSNAEIFIVTNGVRTQNLMLLQDSKCSDNITAIVKYGDGFLIGTSKGKLAMYHFDEEEEEYAFAYLVDLQKDETVEEIVLARPGAKKSDVYVTVANEGVFVITLQSDDDLDENSLLSVVNQQFGSRIKKKAKKKKKTKIHGKYYRHKEPSSPTNGSTAQTKNDKQKKDDDEDEDEKLVAVNHKQRQILHKMARLKNFDICEQRHTLVTSGDDGSVEVRYMIQTVHGQTPAVAHHTFNDVPLAISCHPLSWHVLIGFRSHIGLYHIVGEELHLSYHISINSKTANRLSIRYSRGGHLFAVADNHYVYIYDSVTCELLQTISGHVGIIKSIRWSDDDNVIISCSGDGAIYAWDVRTRQRLADFVDRKFEYRDLVVDWGSKFTSQSNKGSGQSRSRGSGADGHDELDSKNDSDAYEESSNGSGSYLANDPSNDVAVIVGQERTRQAMHYVSRNGQSKDVYVVQKGNNHLDLSSVQITRLCLMKKRGVLAAGTGDGQILLFNWPFTRHERNQSVVVAKCYAKYQVHNSAIVTLKAFKNTGMLFSQGLDGHLFLLEVATASGMLNFDRRSAKSASSHRASSSMRALIPGGNSKYAGNFSSPIYRGDHSLILVEKDYFAKVVQQTNSHNFDLNKAKTDAAYRLKLTKDHYYMELRKTRKDLEDIVAKKQQEIKNIKLATRFTQADHEKELQKMEDQKLKEMETLRGYYEERLSAEYDRFAQKDKELKETIVKYDTEIANMKKRQTQLLVDEKKQHKDDVSRLEASLEAMQQKLKTQQKQYEVALTTLENENDIQVISTKEQAKANSLKDKQTLAVLEAEIRSLRKKHEASQAMVTNLEIRTGELEMELGKRADMIATLQCDAASMKQKLKEQESELGFRQQELLQSRQDEGSLRTFQSVLRQQIELMKEREDPAHETILQLVNKVNSLDCVLVKKSRDYAALSVDLLSCRERLKDMGSKVVALRHRLAKKENKWLFVVKQMDNLINHTPAIIWKEKFLQFYNEFVTDRPVTVVQGIRVNPKRGIDALARQKKHLEKKISAMEMKQRLAFQREEMVREQSRTGNMLLIKEVNRLRTENRTLSIENLNLKGLLLQKKLPGDSDSESGSEDGEESRSGSGRKRRSSRKKKSGRLGSSKSTSVLGMSAVRAGSGSSRRGAGGNLHRGSNKSLSSVIQLQNTILRLEQSLHTAEERIRQQQLEITRLQAGFKTTVKAEQFRRNTLDELDMRIVPTPRTILREEREKEELLKREEDRRAQDEQESQRSLFDSKATKHESAALFSLFMKNNRKTVLAKSKSAALLPKKKRLKHFARGNNSMKVQWS